MNMILLDNTLSTKLSSKENEKFAMELLKRGKEDQQYSVGMTVNGEGFGFSFGTVKEIYKENGYFYYVVSYTIKNKTYEKILRQKDINLLK